ncbi:MAG TPA: hypothetical protein VLK65_10175 [Vicinamibacteria bacterium]|nr:hypothetical protein [Vicinamibacteria bacterium]
MNFGEWVAALQTALENVLMSISAYLPRLLGAFLVLVVGWILGKLLRYGVVRLIRRAQAVVPARVLEGGGEQWGRFVVRVVGGLAFWLVLLFAAGSAAELLGFAALTGALSGFASYVPRLIAAVLVLLGGFIVGSLAASWIRGAARSARIAYGDSVATVARAAIVLVASVVALAQAGIDSTLLVVAVGTVLGAFLGSVALAFGLGARATVANIIGSHYFQRAYKVSQRIRIGAHEGRILEIRPTGVLLDTSEGVTLVPASAFSEQTTVLLSEDPS